MRYNVGMYGGSFNPLHMGHVRCIISAANMCRELYVVLSVGRRRAEINERVRYRWIYQLTKHIGNVKIIMLEDDADTKEEYTKEYWFRDAGIVKAEIGKHIDVVFCGSDYDENSFWNKCYEGSDFYVFPRNIYNSTDIRKDIYGHSDWMPQIGRTR